MILVVCVCVCVSVFSPFYGTVATDRLLRVNHRFARVGYAILNFFETGSRDKNENWNATLSIPTWSPTVVLTQPDDA